MDIIKVHNAFGNGRVSVQGAQLLDWTVHGQQPLLWCSEPEHWQRGKAIRGGVPICFPWFGAAPTSAQATAAAAPFHGFARLLDWQLLHHHDREHGSELVFELTDNAHTRALWPYGFVARLHLLLSNYLRIGFSYDLVGAGGLQPPAPTTFHPTAALHTYLRVSDLERVALHGLGPHYTERGEPHRGTTFTRLHGPADRIYTAPAPYGCVRDLDFDRRLSLWHRGHSDVVLWNPGQALADAPEQQWRQFVCVETARIHRPLTPGGELAVEIVEV